MSDNNKKTKEAIEQIVEAVNVIAGQAFDSARKATKSVKEKIEQDQTISEAVSQVQEAAKKATKTVKDTLGRLDAPEVKTYVQYAGKEISQKEMIETIAAMYIEEGHEACEIKEMELYIKPEDNAVYYVINGTDTGKIYM